jgi:hypothetical protein
MPMLRDLAEKLNDGRSPKRIAHGFNIRCLLHENHKNDDRTPSLSIWLENGRVHFHCHAGCDRVELRKLLVHAGIPLSGRIASPKGETKTGVSELLAAWRGVELKNFTEDRILRLALSIADQRNSCELMLGRQFVSDTAGIPYGTAAKGLRRVTKKGIFTKLQPTTPI